MSNNKHLDAEQMTQEIWETMSDTERQEWMAEEIVLKLRDSLISSLDQGTVAFKYSRKMCAELMECDRGELCAKIDEYGGHFMRGLSTALRYADDRNMVKLVLLFGPDLWRYHTWGEADEDRRNLGRDLSRDPKLN